MSLPNPIIRLKLLLTLLIGTKSHFSRNKNFTDLKFDNSCCANSKCPSDLFFSENSSLLDNQVAGLKKNN